jgi:signal transduction histidine kinase
LYYALYLLAASVYFLFRRRFLLEYFWSEMPILNTYVWTISISAVAIFYNLFMRHFFNTPQDAPGIDRQLKIWIWLKVIFAVGLSAIVYFTYNMRLVLAIGILPVVAEIIFSFYVLIRLNRIARNIAPYFLIGSGILLLAALSYVIYFVGLRFGLYNVSHNMLLLLEAGILLEMIFFSLGLAHRMQINKAEKLKAQSELIRQLRRNERLQTQVERELKQKVEERTAQIQEKSLELARQNEEISAQRDMLEAQKGKIELQNKELSMKNQELRSLNEEKNYLIGIVAHDLRNPLASVLSVSELMLAEAEDLTNDQLECVQHINSTLSRMATMVNRILDIKQIDAQEIDIRLEHCNLSALVREVGLSFRNMADDKQIRLHLQVADQVAADLDRGYTIQVLENLISNAIKFSDSGKSISVGLQNGEQSVRLWVKDEGPGISADDMQKLFGKYQRLSAKPTGGESSTGLGLSIVKKYVEAMRGRVWCESVPAQGATFIVEFDKV